MASETTVTTTDANKQRAIDAFRLHLTAAGYRAYLLNDNEVWRWLTRLIVDMNRHVAARHAFDGDLDDVERKAAAFGEGCRKSRHQ